MWVAPVYPLVRMPPSIDSAVAAVQPEASASPEADATSAGAGRTQREQEQLAPHRPLTDFYATPEERRNVVVRMFDESARYYDRVSGLLSGWSDRYYRKRSLHRAGLRPGQKLLDVASGTGLVVSAALQLGVPAEDITGLDPSAGMLEENRKRHPEPVTLVQGLGEKMPLPDGTFDVITMGYALRHVEDLRALFSEFRRVLKPGGRVLIMEISRPDSRFLFAILRLYMGKLVPRLTRLITRNPAPARLMSYYWATVEECVPAAVIMQALDDSGFASVERRTTGGVLNDYTAVNPPRVVV
jgi:demethylmenaquinone methyltransferase/2-methoxy-6-polyprenyl-1,4-benzoquinol methylase